jgi:hypothetical protein
MIIALFRATFALALFISPAFAQMAAQNAYAAVTVGTSDSVILSGGGSYHFLDIVNNSASATVCINFNATATISGTSCSTGEIALPPLWHRSWEGSFVPTDAIHAIASAASTPASVGAK